MAPAIARIHGVHSALVCLGSLTILSALIFRQLRSDDGASISHSPLDTSVHA